MKSRALFFSILFLPLALVSLTADIPTAWTSGSNYNSGDLVIYNGTAYQAQQPIIGSTTAPDASSTWKSLDTIASGKTEPAGEPDTSPDTDPPQNPQVTVTVTPNPSAGGSVTGGGTMDEGSSVTLIAYPANHYTFTSWSGDLTGTDNPATVSVNEDMTITANFLRKPVLTITANPAGAGSVQGGGEFPPGTSVTLTATPSAGYLFKDWSGNLTGTQNPATVTMNTDMTITANFEVRKYTVTVLVEGNGTVPGAGEYVQGTQVTLTATPNTGHAFLGWVRDYLTYLNPEGNSPSKSVSISSSDIRYKALFSPIVEITDANLEAAIRQQLGWSNSNHPELGVSLDRYPTQITQAHMELLTRLWADDRDIAGLEGLQYAKNLETLDIQDNKIADPSHVWNLSKLRNLEIDGNRFTSLDGIEKLTGLEYVDLDSLRLTSISQLRDLPSLRMIEIEENHLDLSNATVKADIKYLRDRGVEVEAEWQLPKGVRDLQGEMATLRGRLATNPNDAQANFLYAFELLLDLFEDKGTNSLKATAVSAGVSDSITSFVLPDLWLEDDDHDFTLNRNSDLNELTAHFENAFLPTLATIDMHLARISSGMLISLPQDQTGMEDEMLVDHGDALALRAGLKALSGYIRTLTSYDWSMNAGKADDLDESGTATLETVLDAGSALGSLRTNHHLTQAKQDFKEAVSLYKQASEVIRGRMSVERLINMESEDLADEAEFRVELDEFLKALDQQAFGREAGEDTVDLSRLFSGKVDFRAMIPKATKDKFATHKVPDPTFGGLLPTWDFARVKQEMLDADLLSTVPDSALAKELRNWLWVGQPEAADRDITPQDLAWLNQVWLEEENIRDLTGLEHATNLRYLDLEGNKIDDLSPLLDLPNLQQVDLDWNNLNLSSVETLNAINKLRAKGVQVSVGTQRSKYLQNMSAEMASLKSTLNGNPNDAKANFVYGLYLLLNVFESDSFKNLLISAGMSETFRNFTLMDIDVYDEDDFTLNREFNLSEGRTFLSSHFILEIDKIDGYLARIGPSSLISLTSEDTGAEDEMLADQADALAIRAFLKFLSAWFRIQAAYDWDFNAGKGKDLDDADFITLETIREHNPKFLSVANATLLSQAKTRLKEFVSLYKQASPLLRARLTQERLLNLDVEDLEGEEEFVEALDELLVALDGPHELMDDSGQDDPVTINLAPFFAGKLDLSTLFPESVGDKFVDAETPDATFGGILPKFTKADFREFLEEENLLASDVWEGAKKFHNAPNWGQSHWWGEFYRPINSLGQVDSEWIYHHALGWVYPMAASPGNMWFWQGSHEHWLWTNKQVYPYVYSHSEKAWLYLFTNSRRFVIWRGSDWGNF